MAMAMEGLNRLRPSGAVFWERSFTTRKVPPKPSALTGLQGGNPWDFVVAKRGFMDKQQQVILVPITGTRPLRRLASVCGSLASFLSMLRV